MYTHSKQIKQAGAPLDTAERAIIMIHGRGATAESILSLAEHLQTSGAALLAPQATNNSWYPYGFMASSANNQPALDSAISLIQELVKDILAAGISRENIWFVGFSQGACLSLEYVARNAAKYGGVIAFTGGLIGETLHKENYKGDLSGTPFFISTGDPDPHVPFSRVEESIKVLQDLGANITAKVYKGKAHTILYEEIALANNLLVRNLS